MRHSDSAKNSFDHTSAIMTNHINNTKSGDCGRTDKSSYNSSTTTSNGRRNSGDKVVVTKRKNSSPFLDQLDVIKTIGKFSC